MKIKSKVIQSTDLGYFENKLNDFYKEYVDANIEIKFAPLIDNVGKIMYMALVTVRKEVE